MKIRAMGAAVLMGATAYLYSEPALAADAGGDCCADLEQRIAELEATTARKGNRKVSLTVSGQVTQALMFWDDGDDSDVFIVDPQTSGSRFRFTGSAKINPNLSAGFNIEVAVLTSPSNTVTQDDDDGGIGGDGNLAVRLAYWDLNDKRFGRLSVGRLSMASDGVAEIDLGGANIVAQSGLFFANDFKVVGNGNTFDTFAVGNFELDRNNAVRYDTPTFGGFTASASFGEDDRWDVALRYAGEFSGFQLAAAIGYGVDTDELPDVVGPLDVEIDERRFLIGSASLLHLPSGLFVSASAGQRTNRLVDGSEFDEDTWSVRGGLSKDWFGIGKTVLYGEYHSWQNGNNTGIDADIWGVGVVQNIDAAAMELFLAYKNYSINQAGTEDINLVIIGSRIKF